MTEEEKAHHGRVQAREREKKEWQKRNKERGGVSGAAVVLLVGRLLYLQVSGI